MKPMITSLTLTLTIMSAGTAFAVDKDFTQINSKIDAMVAKSFPAGEGQDLSRLKQDETQKKCSVRANKPTATEAAEIMARERASIKYPESGNLMGDWKKGEKLVKSGFGMRIGVIEPDPVAKQKGGNGGNCYACHAISPKEVAAGNIGNSLVGYGKTRGTSAEIIQYTYDKIYNAQAFMPCSNMPRFGHNGIITAQQVADITAFLLSPESPVNQ
ncbi:MAG: sulfur oxidation c-type cytochrome SoxX [Gammaproteobacteria bacterium]|nr:sulfur oxidation c-type cytochrome SoxX [Gammaproteobacteria bacterium]